MADADLLDPGTAFDPPIATDPAEIREEYFARMRERMPGWEPVPTSPLTHLFAVAAESAAESRQAFISLLRAQLLDLLGSLHGIPRQLGVPARGTITVRAIDRLGHQLDAGTTVTLGDVELETVFTLTIPVGEDSASTLVQTVEPGASANGADGEVQVDALDWVASDGGVTLDAPLADGVDPETQNVYSFRVADELGLLTLTPILPANFSVVARRHPRCAHAWTIDRYNPDADPPTGHAQHTTTVCTGLLGEGLDPDDLAQILASIVAVRESTFFPHVVSPSYVTVDADIDVITYPGWDLDQVASAVRDRLTAVLSPAPWLQPPYGINTGYTPTRLVHRNELVAQADGVLGVDIVSSATIADGRSDSVALGPLELPTPGAITVRAVAPAE